MEQELESTPANKVNNRFKYELTFSGGNAGHCGKIEGEFKIFYYNGPLESKYVCNTENGNSVKRNLLILEDVGFMDPKTQETVDNETLTIKRIIPKTTAEAEPNM